MLLLSAISLSIVALITLAVNPIAGIPLLFIVKPVVDAVYLKPLLFGLRLPEMVGALVPMVVFGWMAFAGPPESLRRMPLRTIWTGYALSLLLSSSIIAYNQTLLEGTNIFLRHINGFIGFYMVQAFFHQERRLKILLIAFMVAGLFPVGVGMYQAATGTVWKAELTEGIARNIGLWHDSVSIREYAAQTVLALLLYGALYIKNINIPLKVATLAYLGLAVVVIAKTYSKAGYLSLIIWASCWTLLQKRYLVFALITIGGTVAVAYYGSHFVGNVQQMFHKEIGFLHGQVAQERTFAGRWYGWEEMMAEWDKLGWPSKTFGSGKVALGAHNDYLLLLFNGGIVGLGIYLSLLASIGVRIAKNLWRRADPMTVAALMLFLMWMVDTIGLVPSAYPGYQWFVWGMIGLSLRLREDESRAAERLVASRDTTVSREIPGVALGIPPALAVERRFPSLLR